jgi:hypothetical protein
LKKPKWLQSLTWEKPSTKSDRVKKMRRQTDQSMKQQSAQEERKTQAEKDKSDGRRGR